MSKRKAKRHSYPSVRSTPNKLAHFYEKLIGSLCQWHDEGLRAGVFIGFTDTTATIRPIGAYGTHPRNIKWPLEEVSFPTGQKGTHDAGSR